MEDDQPIRQMIISTLQADGYECAGAPDTSSAMDSIRTRRPDLIITDYHLPGADGLELLRALQTEGFGDIPALVISADSRPPDWPSTSFIPKPFDLDAILRAVRRALGRGSDEPDVGPRLTLASWLRQPGLALA